MLALWPLLTAMALVLIGNQLVKKHCQANGIQAPRIAGRAFYGWLPPSGTSTKTSVWRKATIAALVALYALIALLIVLGLAHNHVERAGKGL